MLKLWSFVAAFPVEGQYGAKRKFDCHVAAQSSAAPE
jgi:hypothetical protein